MPTRLPQYSAQSAALLLVAVAFCACSKPEVVLRSCESPFGRESQALSALTDGRGGLVDEFSGCLSLSTENRGRQFENVKYTIISPRGAARIVARNRVSLNDPIDLASLGGRRLRLEVEANGGIEGPCTFGCRGEFNIAVNTIEPRQVITPPVEPVEVVAPETPPATPSQEDQEDQDTVAVQCLLPTNEDEEKGWWSAWGLPVVPVGCPIRSLIGGIQPLIAQGQRAAAESEPNACSEKKGMVSIACEPCVKELREQSLIEWFEDRYPRSEAWESTQKTAGEEIRELRELPDDLREAQREQGESGIPTLCYRDVTVVRSQSQDFSAFGRYHVRENEQLWSDNGDTPNEKPIVTERPADGIIYKVEWKITYHNKEAWLVALRGPLIETLAQQVNDTLKTLNDNAKSWTPTNPRPVDFTGDPNVKGPDIVYKWPGVRCTNCDAPMTNEDVGAEMRVAFEPTDHSISITLSLGGYTQEQWQRARTRYLYGQVRKFAVEMANSPVPKKDSEAR